MTTSTKNTGSILALNPVYSTDRVNGEIRLYNNSLKIEQKGITIETNGALNLEWLPFPMIKLSITENDSTVANKLKQFELKSA